MELMSEQPPRDETLRDLVISQARNGQIEVAKQMASQITDRNMQRWAWRQILYAQVFVSMDLTDAKVSRDLTGVRATLASLQDDSLWYGSWVPDLLNALVQNGDTAGAIAIVSRLKEPFMRGLHYGDIAGILALKNDSEGVEGILRLVSEDLDRVLSADLDMVDIALGVVARQYAWVTGNLDRARQYAARISGEKERNWILAQIEHPPLRDKR